VKTWIRARFEHRCGRCDAVIPAEAPMLVYHQWLFVRCVKCADEPAPADVAALPDTMPTRNIAVPRPTPARASVDQPTALDPKQRQLGGDQ
jgi:hypothetical protein